MKNVLVLQAYVKKPKEEVTPPIDEESYRVKEHYICQINSSEWVFRKSVKVTTELDKEYY